MVKNLCLFKLGCLMQVIYEAALYLRRIAQHGYTLFFSALAGIIEKPISRQRVSIKSRRLVNIFWNIMFHQVTIEIGNNGSGSEAR